MPEHQSHAASVCDECRKGHHVYCLDDQGTSATCACPCGEPHAESLEARRIEHAAAFGVNPADVSDEVIDRDQTHAAESCGCPEAGGYLPVHLRGCRYFSATSLELSRMTSQELEDAVQEWVDNG